ncbi:hypothetical protein SACE_0476 [Saccharopolyspora erythraea prophage pSE101]|uniref:Uncharacterized protein n=1 Tax=Saccharopolyspora erythraea (strain ATCC 11635 / DSM 40517 / JCM 4748 / NBRC 13426 / NCIMB 8594 / NRRL 2338) TaxID=405948 RepID=A4F701_SACEN|nr:hypothetical protein N599_26930 [Saccharopolyspora erythraea D]CAL99825.1 hypothetical protein SACE_0476 [Saccharopolyspora erythraea NRRL 2338]
MGSFVGRACSEVLCHLISGNRSAGCHVGESFAEVPYELGVGEHFDRFSQPIDLARRHDVGNVLAMRDDGHALATFGTLDGFVP